MKNIIKKRKVLLILSVITTVLIIGIVGTYAWYTWSSDEEQRTKIVTSVGAATVVYEDGASLLGQNIRPVEDKNKGFIKNISVRTNINTAYKVSFNLYLDITTLGDGLKHESFKYELWNEDELVKSGDFTQEYLNENLVTCSKNNTSHIVLLNDITITKTLSKYKLYIWIDGANYTNPNTMMNQKFSFKLHADGQGAIIGEANTPNMDNIANGTLAYSIVNLYNNNSQKEKIVNGGVRYYVDTDNNLISDVEGNVRYYGINPNNYVYFNCNDYANPSSSTCERWRIIGVFDGKVKIVRDEILGEYSWDYSSDGKYDNNWEDSTINELLNNGYYNNSNNISYNNNGTATTINFAGDNTGLKNDYTRSLISSNTWYLGGDNSSDFYSSDMYKIERGYETGTNGERYWNGKIALMYPSDYGYASDLSVCNSMLGKYNSSSNCYGTNWLHKGVLQRLITPNAPNGNAVKVIGSTGNVHNNPTNNVYSIRPTLYLNADVVAYSGDGSKCYPYVLYPVKESSQSHSNNAVQYINNLYLNNKNKIVTNNDIEYQYAESVNLMNDRLGGTTTAYDAGNIRYYGVNPNNYVDIGDRDDSCNVIPYRIIGVFKNVELSDGTKKDLIKVIRARSIGDYSFDNKPDGIGSSTSNYGSNDWSDARLMILLNPGYSIYNSNNPLLDSSGDVIYGYRGSLWWNSDSDKCYSGSNNATKSCNFISDGLSKSVHNKIETIFWRLGYSSSAYDHSNDYYAKEITGNKWVGKVALMSLADYGYAADFNGCTDYLHYYTDVCKDNDWLYTGNSQLVLFRYYSNRGWIVTSAGGVYDYQDISTSRSVRPTFYLNSELDIVSGNGTITSPYVIN